jgi:NAD(P)-dependent dehydrogenase (short-subunit alcohol dehydrogenase family)
MAQMVKQQGGVIINTGSITGEEGCRNNVGYATSKAGIMNGMTKSLAQYGAQHGIRCCCVAPGPVLTRAAMAAMKTMTGKAAEPIEIVNMIMYLTSDKAVSITGTTFFVDGGRAASGHGGYFLKSEV